jgi:hypothetical protein
MLIIMAAKQFFNATLLFYINLLIRRGTIYRIVVKRSMVLALFYVVAIQTVLFSVTRVGHWKRDGAIKSVHIQAAKIKQFLQSRKYIYFWREKIYLVERESVIYYKPDIGRKEKGRSSGPDRKTS